MVALPIAILAMEDSDDRRFMEGLYLEYRELMYAVTYKVLRNHQDVEDVIDSAVVALIKKISVIRDMSGCTLRSYIVSTVRNTAINVVVRSKRQRAHMIDDGEDELNKVSGGKAIDYDLLRGEDVQVMRRVLARLSDDDRDLLRMKYFDELSDKEIAEILETRESTVRMRLTRARRRAREQMMLGGAEK